MAINLPHLQRLLGFAQSNGLRVTSREYIDSNGVPHVPSKGHAGPNDPHYRGDAIDVGMRGYTPTQQEAFMAAAKAQGFEVLDERYTGNGPHGVSTGPHLHLQIPSGPGSSAVPSVPSNLTPIQQTVVDAANQYGVPPNILLATIERESGFRPAVTSTTRTGRVDVGLGQLSPGVAQHYGVTDRSDPAQNAAATAQYLRDLHAQWGDWDSAVAHYIGYGSSDAYRGSRDYQRQTSFEQQWQQRLGSSPSNTPAGGTPDPFGYQPNIADRLLGPLNGGGGGQQPAANPPAGLGPGLPGDQPNIADRLLGPLSSSTATDDGGMSPSPSAPPSSGVPSPGQQPTIADRLLGPLT